MEAVRKYAKFVIAAAGLATLVAEEAIVQPDQDLSSPEGWIKVVIAVVVAVAVRQKANSPA